jgi:hypothetical protein
MSVFGWRYMGKIGVVPGLLHVSTRFFHINFVPLVPLGSAIVLANSGHRMANGKEGILTVEIPFNWKSFLMAYWRGILNVAFYGSAALLALNQFIALSHQKSGPLYPPADPKLLTANIAAIAISGLLLYWSFRASLASRERAVELGRLAGFQEQVVLQQLAHDGYPFSSPARGFGVRVCKACKTLNQGISAEDGSMVCGHCNKPLPRQSANYTGILVFLLIVAMGVAAAYLEKKH